VKTGKFSGHPDAPIRTRIPDYEEVGRQVRKGTSSPARLPQRLPKEDALGHRRTCGFNEIKPLRPNAEKAGASETDPINEGADALVSNILLVRFSSVVVRIKNIG
jgi:hypothetical protein